MDEAIGSEAVTPSETTSPVGAADRIGSLDFIRGIAVMGILAANIVAFGQPFAAYMYPDSFLTEHGPASDWMWVIQFVVVDGKMRGLFTLLFGAGLILFMEKAWARGETRWLQARRLFWLLLFGLAHFYFIWRGDILALYAMVGLIVLPLLKLSAKSQLLIGLAGYGLGAMLLTAMLGPLHFVASTALGDQPQFAQMREELAVGKAQTLADDSVETQLVSQGKYGAWIEHNLTTHLGDPFTNLFLFGAETLPLMLIGVAMFRLGLFSGGFDPASQRMWGWIGLVGGGLASLAIALWVKSTGYTYYGTIGAMMAFSMLPRLVMTLGLAALLSLFAQGAAGWLGQRIAAAGRVAFTNYLGTSILMLFVFHGWALGLYGSLNRLQLYIVVVITWVVMLAWSKPWLAHFRYGPLEWLWRCLTYGRLFPLRR